jgi:mono/diheme cytochrome c family protein
MPALLPVLMLCLILSAVARGETGAEIYQHRCAACHGPVGEGTDDAPSALIGDKSVSELSAVIAATMPQDTPGTCTGDDAARVATYIHEEFYSPIAQARRRPPRVEFSRLKVGQHRNAVADLLGSFRPAPPQFGPEQGLLGRYLPLRDGPMDEHSFTRTDPVIDFDFGEASPNPEKTNAEEFGVWWHGAVYAPDSGEYEFIVETKNGMRLWVNEYSRPLIDGTVRSGESVTWRESVPLLGGRFYLLKMEFFKSKAAKEKVAAVRLKWKPPHGTEEIIPGEFLRPQEVPEVFVLRAPFPPDDRSQGYERGTLISKEWDDATTRAALEVAAEVAGDLSSYLHADDGERNAQVRNFCLRFAQRAFRRPLTSEQTQLIERILAEPADETVGVKRVVLLVLKSPRFLFRETAGDADGFDDFDVASWLSFSLWDSLPDQTLIDATARGELQTREQLLAQSQRMLGDWRAVHKTRGILHQWLNLDRIHDVTKSAEQFPGFDAALVADLWHSLDRLVHDVVWSEASDYRELFLTESLYVNGRIAQFYGLPAPWGAGFERVSADPKPAGVLTHPYLMAGLAYHDTSSPIHRGVFLSRNMLGRVLKPPPDAVTPEPPELHPELTTRERVTLQTSAENCQICHGMINQLGFSLEQFDAVGRFRTEERSQPIDSTGSYITRQGETVPLQGARGLAEFLAASRDAQEAFVAQVFRQLTNQPIQAFGPERLAERTTRFAESTFSIKTLLVESTAESALWMKELGEQSQRTAAAE